MGYRTDGDQNTQGDHGGTAESTSTLSTDRCVGAFATMSLIVIRSDKPGCCSPGDLEAVRASSRGCRVIS